MTITVSTDGSALGNPNGPMGWGWADHDLNAGGTPGHDHAGDCDAGGARVDFTDEPIRGAGPLTD